MQLIRCIANLAVMFKLNAMKCPVKSKRKPLFDFGSKGSRDRQHDDNSCGNESDARGADNGEKHIKANCFILLQ